MAADVAIDQGARRRADPPCDRKRHVVAAAEGMCNHRLAACRVFEEADRGHGVDGASDRSGCAGVFQRMARGARRERDR